MQFQNLVSPASAAPKTIRGRPPPEVSQGANRRLPRDRRQYHDRSEGLRSSEDNGEMVSAIDDSRDNQIVEYLRDVTSKDSDRSYAAEWHFFLECKGKSLCDADLIRSYVFAVQFMEKWQDARITLQVKYNSRGFR